MPPILAEVLEGILDATLGAIQSRHPNSADSRHLVKFFADLVVDSSRENFLRYRMQHVVSKM